MSGELLFADQEIPIVRDIREELISVIKKEQD